MSLSTLSGRMRPFSLCSRSQRGRRCRDRVRAVRLAARLLRPAQANELNYTSVFSGATFGLNVCFQVPTSDAGSLELHYGDSDVGWFALR